MKKTKKILTIILLIIILFGINNVFATIGNVTVASVENDVKEPNLWAFWLISVIPIIILAIINYLQSNNHKKTLIINTISFILWLIVLVIAPKQRIISYMGRSDCKKRNQTRNS